MPKVKGPLFSVSARKSLGKVLTYQGRPGGAAVYPHKEPKVPLTWKQLKQRRLVADAVRYWQGLSDASKAVWELKAKGRGQSGYSLFLHENTALPDDVVLYLAGFEGEGSIIHDLSKYGNHGTIHGATWVRSPTGFWHLSFDGGNDWVDCGNNESLDSAEELTVKLWFKTSSLISGRALICRDPALYKYMLYITGESDEMCFYFRTASGTIAASYAPGAGVIADGNWHQIVGVWQKPYGKLYFDGALVDTSALRDEDIIAGTDYLAIGRYSGSYIPAEIGGVGVRNRSLSDTGVGEEFEAERILVGV